VSKRKYVGLDEPNFDEDADKKRPNAGQEYDPDGDYIYDARKYFNPEKYREIVANQEESKKKQQVTEKKFYYTAFRSHRSHSRLSSHSGQSSVNYVNVRRDGLSSSYSSLLNSEYPVYNIDKLQTDDSRTSGRHKKAKKKSKHTKHHSDTLESSCTSTKRKKSGDKKHKKKRKRKKGGDKHGRSLSLNADDRHSRSLCHNHEYQTEKHQKKLRHRSRHKSKLFSSQELTAAVPRTTNYYHSFGQNSIGNDHNRSNRSHPHWLSDDSISDSNRYHSPSVDDSADSDTIVNYSDSKNNNLVNYAERPVASRSVSDDEEWDSSVSTEYSDVNKDFSATDEENDHNEDVNWCDIWAIAVLMIYGRAGHYLWIVTAMHGSSGLQHHLMLWIWLRPHKRYKWWSSLSDPPQWPLPQFFYTFVKMWKLFKLHFLSLLCLSNFCEFYLQPFEDTRTPQIFDHWHHLVFSSFCTGDAIDMISGHLIVAVDSSSYIHRLKKRLPNPPLPWGKHEHHFDFLSGLMEDALCLLVGHQEVHWSVKKSSCTNF